MTTLHVVEDDQYRQIDRRMSEIKRRLNQKGGSPLNSEDVLYALQQIIEGRFSKIIWMGDFWCNLSLRKINVDLVKIMVQDLGFDEPARYDWICRRAHKLGLDLCPLEVEPGLREWMKVQASWKGAEIYIGMDPKLAAGCIFYIQYDGNGLVVKHTPADLFDPSDLFVFVRRPEEA